MPLGDFPRKCMGWLSKNTHKRLIPTLEFSSKYKNCSNWQEVYTVTKYSYCNRYNTRFGLELGNITRHGNTNRSRHQEREIKHSYTTLKSSHIITIIIKNKHTTTILFLH